MADSDHWYSPPIKHFLSECLFFSGSSTLFHGSAPEVKHRVRPWHSRHRVEAVPAPTPSVAMAAKPPSAASGAQPNLEWRAIAMNDVRTHPLYFALEDPRAVLCQGVADYWRFRQGTWQWDLLHDGRLTTSKMGPALGIYEGVAQRSLGVPQSLAGHHKALHAWDHLCSTVPPRDEALNAEHAPGAAPGWAYPVWHPPCSPSVPFQYEYRPPLRAPRLYDVRNVGEARMVWGSTQEGTSIVAAINYFAARGAHVGELGMCPAEVHNAHAPCAPLLGASPDGAVFLPDETIAALEIKNHSPFAQRGTSQGFTIADPGPHTSVAPWHIPQLMLEMYCIGPACTAAYFMSCSATRGIAVLHVPRDDAYIAAMLHFTTIFHDRFVRPRAEPPEDFFGYEPEYHEFLDYTRSVAEAAQLEALIPDTQVQRSPHNMQFFL